MVDFIENIIKPPDQISEGQVWRLLHSADDVLVIDASHKEEGVLIGVLLSRITELNDGSDVILSSTGKNTSLFASDRIALRISKGPLPKNELGYFRGKITEEEFNKILKSVKHNSFNYNELQKEYIADILEYFASLREQAMREYESLHSDDIIRIVKPKQIEGKPYIYKYAADDITQHEIIREFWLKERKLGNKGVTRQHSQNLEIRINVIDNVLYVMLFSGAIKRVDDIKIIQGDTVVPANDRELNLLNENRAFTSFDAKNLRTGKCILRFTVNDKVNNLEIELQ